MTFVDTNVIMYAVGRSHPLKPTARLFFERAVADPSVVLCTSSEVLQELLHAYLPVQRIETLDAALHLAKECVDQIWSVDVDDVMLARALVDTHPGIDARDLLHLASCRRRGVENIMSFDRALQTAFRRPSKN